MARDAAKAEKIEALRVAEEEAEMATAEKLLEDAKKKEEEEFDAEFEAELEAERASKTGA